MSGWRKCDTCRKVRPVEDFDDDSPTCVACLTAPSPKRRTAASPVTTTRRPAAPPAPSASPPQKRPLMGAVGMGDLEVRERRARRAALDALAAAHPDDFAELLRDARRAEGLRPLGTEDRPAEPRAADPASD